MLVSGAMPTQSRGHGTPIRRRAAFHTIMLFLIAVGVDMIKLGFFGAAGEVTGSCYMVTTDRAQVMVDMGMHQGEKVADAHNRRMPPLDLAKLDAVVLTHAHLDHCGRLPHANQKWLSRTYSLHISHRRHHGNHSARLGQVAGGRLRPLHAPHPRQRSTPGTALQRARRRAHAGAVDDDRLRRGEGRLPKGSRSNTSTPGTSWARRACR